MKREHPFGPYIADDLKQIRLNAKTEDSPHALTCYHAQQYVEKVLKDVIWQFTGVMESGHNMVGLMDILGGILEERGIMDTDDPDFVAMRRLCSKLGPYNKNTRYPPASPFDERITFDERTAREAVGMAYAIVAWLDTVELDDGTPYAESRSLRSRMRRRKVRDSRVAGPPVAARPVCDRSATAAQGHMSRRVNRSAMSPPTSSVPSLKRTRTPSALAVMERTSPAGRVVPPMVTSAPTMRKVRSTAMVYKGFR